MKVNLVLYAVYALILFAALALKNYQPTNAAQNTEPPPPTRQTLSGLEHADEIAFVTERGDLFIPIHESQPYLLIYAADGHRIAELKSHTFLCATNSYAVVASGSNVSAITLSGEPLWQSEMHRQPSRGVCTPDRVYLSDFNAISVFSSKGAALWTRDVPSPNIPGDFSVDTDGTIYYGSVAGDLESISPGGSILWETHANSLSAGKPVPDGKGRIYRTDSERLSAIDKNGGAVIWQSRIAAKPFTVDSLPVLAADGRICLARRSLFCFSDGGRQQWRFDPDSAQEKFAAPPIFDQRGSAYLYSQGRPGRAYAVSNSGMKEWSYPVGETLFNINPMKFTADGSLWKSTERGFLSFDFKH